MPRLDAMRAMVAAQPSNALARFGLANELLKANLLEEAETELGVYLGSYDDEGNGWLRYADVLYALGRAPAARDAATKGIEASRKFGHGSMVAEFESRLEDWE